MDGGFVDIHCHMLPGIDDGAADWQTSLEMARMAVADGTQTVVVTPHQLGNYSQNRGDQIRQLAQQFQQLLLQHNVPLQVLPGADVRIEDGMLEQLTAGEVLSLGDHLRHVLLELPHELYFPIEFVLYALHRQQMVGILSHPERNKGIQREPDKLGPLVEAGCLMQVTAGSLMGTFGNVAQELGEWMLKEGLVHFIATDAHGIKSRRPLMKRAFDRVEQLTDRQTALDLCVHSPELVARNRGVKPGRRKVYKPEQKSWLGFLGRRKSA